MAAPKLVEITFAGDPLQSSIDSFMRQLVATTSYWAGATAEYGVGPFASLSVEHLAEAAPASVADLDVRRWLKTKILTGVTAGFPQPDGNTIYVVYYPAATALTMGAGALCTDFQGYHDDFALAPGGPFISYAIVGRCPSPVPGLPEMDEVSAEASHEIVEVATDPLPTDGPAFIQVDADHLAWQLLGGPEIGDLCAGNADAWFRPPGIDNLVQRVWSNAAAAAGHNPCAPRGMTPYFNSAPVLGDAVQISNSTFGSFATKGVKIPIGSSKTIEVDLYSDAPTTGPWQVRAIEFGNAAPTLRFSFDKTAGLNGDKLHLTITALAAGAIGASPFLIESSLGPAVNLWVGVVGN